MRAVATEACRRASNGAAFLNLVREQTGLPVDVISTREEAELAVESCASLLHGPGRRALLFDIGGGSTEIAWIRLSDARTPELIGYASLPVGVVNLAERFGAAAHTAAGYEAMIEDVARRLLPFERVHCIAHEQRLGGVRLLGTSGTVTTLAGVALNLPRYLRALVDGTVLTDAAASGALRALRALGPEGLALHPCVGPERAEFAVPGCAVFEAIRRTWPADQVTVADRGLREGMLLRMMRDRAPRSAPRRDGAPGRAGPA